MNMKTMLAVLAATLLLSSGYAYAAQAVSAKPVMSGARGEVTTTKVAAEPGQGQSKFEWEQDLKDNPAARDLLRDDAGYSREAMPIKGQPGAKAVPATATPAK